MKKIINIFNLINIFNISALFIYYFENLQNFAKTMVIILFNEEIAIEVYKKYTENLVNFKMLMYIYFVILLIKLFINWLNFDIDRKIQKDRVLKSNEINRNLYDYINSNEKKCFVITGNWGVGKTYTIDNFFGKYFKYEKRDVYRISCFGMENRKDILEELKNVFEKQDNSIRKHVLNLCKKIPIIGDLIEDAFKSDYEFKDLREKSIFVFDDFERITVPKYENYTNRLYRGRTRYSTRNSNDPFGEIYKKFKEIESGFERFEDSVKEIREEQKLEKYNIITGLINELIERYNMKVILICNKSEIHNEFFNDIFECKIESIIYKISDKSKITQELALKNIENKIYLKEDLKRRLKDFFASEANIIDLIWEKSGVNNIRILSQAINAFTEVIEYTEIDEKYEKSLFFTILVCQLSHFTGKNENVEKIATGELIKAFYEKHKVMSEREDEFDTNSLFYFISSESEMADVRWMGSNVGFSYLAGNHCYTGFFEELKIYDEYNWNLEEKIFHKNDESYFEENEIYKFDDLMYLLKINENNKEKINEILKILESANIDYISHTSFEYGSMYLGAIRNENNDIAETIISIIALYRLNDNVIYSVLKKIINVIGEKIIKESNKLETEKIKKVKEICRKVIEENQFVNEIK